MNALRYPITLLLALALTQPLCAVSESLLDDYDARIEEYFAAGNGGTYKSFDGTEVGYWALHGSGRPIVMVTGLGEAFDHYKEIVYDLRTLERPIYIVELRSQGHGDRLSTAHRDAAYIESFDDYLKDLETFVRQQVDSEEPIDFFGHSTGAYPVLRYAAEYPGRVNQVILIAPLVEVQTGWAPHWLANAVAGAYCLVGLCDDFVISAREYRPGSYKFEGNRLTSSEARFKRIFSSLDENPQIRSGGPSNHWLLEAMKIPETYGQIAGEIKAPVLIMTADTDKFTSPVSQAELCKKIKSCEQITFDNSQHVLLHETDRVRDPAMEKILSWLRTN
jgi:lysophospholipase